jgi:hypothetical protein
MNGDKDLPRELSSAGDLPKWPMPDFMFDPAGVDVIRSAHVRRPTLFLPPAEYDELVASAAPQPQEMMDE